MHRGIQGRVPCDPFTRAALPNGTAEPSRGLIAEFGVPRGVEPPRVEQAQPFLYTLLAPVAPLLTRIAPSLATDSTTLGRAMLRVAAGGYERPVLESLDINRVGRAAQGG